MKSITLSSAACSFAAALAIIVLALVGFQNDHATGMFVDGCDPFGYSRMASVIRQARKTGKPTDFFIHDDQTRWLIAQFKENQVPVSEWAELVTTHAHHYFPGTDQVGPQYPPGTGWVLSMFPRSTDVKALDRLTILLVSAGGLLLVGWCAWQGLTASSLMFAGAVGAFLSPYAWLGTYSYSINATLLPLFAGTVAAWMAARCRDWRLSLPLGLIAGLLFGLVVQVRLASVLLVPAAALPFVPRRVGALPGYLVGVVVAGVLPVLLHNKTITGQFLGATYSDNDRRQALGCVLDNVVFYFGSFARESAAFYVLGLTLAVLLWLAATTRLHAPGAPGWRPWLAGHYGLVAAPLCAGGLSVAYFLTHVVAIRYYLTPAMLLVGLLTGFLFVELEKRWQEAATDSATLGAVRNTLAAAVVTAACVGLSFGYPALGRVAQKALAPGNESAPLTVPAELLADRSWVWADHYSSSIVYYTGHPAFKVPFTSTETRRLLFGWIKAKGDAQYLVIDSPDMERVAAEARAAGWQLSPAGIVRDVPCYKLALP